MTNSISVAGGDSLICSSNPSKTINSDDAVGNHTGISNISSYFSRYLLTFFWLVAEYRRKIDPRERLKVIPVKFSEIS